MNYKKAIIITSFLFFFGFLFNFTLPNAKAAKAVTLDDIQAQIQAILQQIKLLQQILQLQQQVTSMTGQSVSWCHNFNTNLRIGDTGSEVEALQTALKKEGFALGDDKTGEFGEYTASAVVAFQEKYRDEILSPLHLVHGTGYVGPSTRAKLNKLYGCGVVQPPTGKYINIISPNGGEVLEIGKTYEIKWETGGFSQSAPVQIRIYNVNYSSEAGDCSEYVISNTINTGKYYWTPKLWGKCPEGNGYKIKIYIEGSGDESDNTFSIVSSNISDWKTYTNYAYGIGLKYPADWRLEDKNSCYDTDPNHNCLAEIQFVPPSTYKFSWVSLRIYGKFWHLEGRETGADGCRLIADYKINDKYLYRLSTCMGVGQEGTESIYNAMLATIKFSNLTSCTDSDGGKNYYMRGTVSDGGKSYTDYCIDSSTLREYFCLPYTPGGLGGVAQEDYKCPNGCKDGACVLATKSINIISPNGGEVWMVGETRRITWTASGVNYVRIYIINTSGIVSGSGNTNYIYDGLIPASQGYYNWTITQNQLPGGNSLPGNYKIRIDGVNEPYGPVIAQDFSDNSFTIVSNSSLLDKDALLHKLFPNLSFKNGVADLASAGDSEYSSLPGLKLYLKDSIEDYFTNNQEKNLLFVVQLDGVAHAGGLYHAYLGLFDKKGNLLTPSSPFPKPNVINPYGANYYDFFQDKVHFGGDKGEFGFYNCKGVTYILFVSHGCPNGTCCDGSAKLFRINNSNFEEVQAINSQTLARLETRPLSMTLPIVNATLGSSYNLKMIISGDKILVKKVPLTSDNGCPETDYKVLKWNGDTCRFE
jgi:hypothetical protein